MEKTDAKIRLFLELSNQHPIQILNYVALKDYKEWTPEKMYENPKAEYYYAFINDIELISRIKDLITLTYDDIAIIKEKVDNIKDMLLESNISLEFNGCNIEIFEDLERNRQKIPLINENNNEENILNNINTNIEEERFVVFCRFFPKNFGFIHSYERLNKEDIDKILEKTYRICIKRKNKDIIKFKKKRNWVKKRR